MSNRVRLWALVVCLVATVAILSLALLPSHSSAGYVGATTHPGDHVACGSVGPDPTKPEVEQFAARLHYSRAETAKLLDCFGFTGDSS